MALGGGTWLSQDKILPGSYINFTNRTMADSVLSTRGIAAAPLILSWGQEGKVFEVSAENFRMNSLKLFGYTYDAPQLRFLREIFCNALKVFCFRLGEGTKAQSTHATAKYPGVRGNDISIKIAEDVDNEDYYVVGTYLSGICVDEQLVQASSGLVDNDFVDFKSFTMTTTAGTALTGGADDSSISGEDYQLFLDAIEEFSYNALCCPAKDSTTVGLFINYTKRMRDDIGAKFQLVAWQPSGADYEGVIGVWNDASVGSADADIDLLYWVTGAQAAAAVNRSLTNGLYNGELEIDTAYTQAELEDAIKAGKFMFHSVNGTVRILEDINSLTTLTEEKGEIFQQNHTVRICDQIANDVAALFNTRYVGVVPNDGSGRATLWNDVVKIIRRLETERAIENFDTSTVTVSVGDRKGTVVLTLNGIHIVNTMRQLYMSVIIQ